MRKKVRRKSKPANRPSTLGMFQALIFGVGFYVVSLLSADPTGGKVQAQTTAPAFKPIGSVSLVDQYDGRDRRTAFQVSSSNRQTSGYSNPNVRQVAMQSGGMGFPFPGDTPGSGPSGSQPNPPSSPNGFAPPPLNAPPTLSQPPASSQPPPNLQPAPQPSTFPAPRPQQSTTPPVSFPQAPNANLPNRFPPSGSPAPRTLPNYAPSPMADYQPVAPPQIANGGFATMSDCRLISPPSSYTAMSPYGGQGSCGCGVAPTSYAGAYNPPPAQIAAPAAMPPAGALAPGQPGFVGVNPTITAGASAAPVGSLVTFGQENYPVQVGQGLWGQPVAFVPGQSFRNWLRYLSF